MELSKAKSSLFKNLCNKKFRDKHGLFLAEGVKCAQDLMTSFEVEYIVTSQSQLECLNLPENYNDKILIATKEQINHISSLSTPQEFIAILRIPEIKENNLKLEKGKLYMALDGVQDPGNLGTIIRVCDWFGVDFIYASKDTVDVYNPKVIQATMGSLARVQVIYCDLKSLIKENPEMPVFGTFLNGEDIFHCRLNDEGVIIMGNEGNGISKEMETEITNRLFIPPYDPHKHGESLNVGIAAAITLAQFRNRN